QARVALDMTHFLLEPRALVRDLYLRQYWRRMGWSILRVTAARCVADLQGQIDEIEGLLQDATESR
ncbi:MAG TPA: hypothetical protein DCQ06_02155, partial [Myxococcales bacterium]|nr:hypothetical protein [Myxococcales bacterium]